MKNLSNKSRKERESDTWNDFVASLAGKSKSEIKETLGNILSEKEKQNIVYRLTAIDLLKQGKSYREIGCAIWLSPQTISAIKKSFLNKIGDYKSYRSAPRQKKTWSNLHPPRKPAKNYYRHGTGIMEAWDVQQYRARFKK